MAMHLLSKLTQRKRNRGRGIGSRRGGKSGRGMKGQRARAGSHFKPGFEGGQTPLYMRLPKGRGTKHRFTKEVLKPIAISLGQLNRFAAGTIVGPGQMRKAGLVTRTRDTVKIIASGSLDKKLTVRAHGVSAAALKAIATAGGKFERIA